MYESHRLRGPVDLPLKNRRHPLDECVMTTSLSFRRGAAWSTPCQALGPR